MHFKRSLYYDDKRTKDGYRFEVVGKIMFLKLYDKMLASEPMKMVLLKMEMMNEEFLGEVIGWSMWFAEYLFLERSWAKDESTLKLGLQRFRDFPRPFWLALFVEGTRFTPAKLLAAQEYAASQGLPTPRNVLIPRTKGFVSAVNVMRSFVPAVYDVTVAIPKGQPSPTMLGILKGQSSVNPAYESRWEDLFPYSVNSYFSSFVGEK
ncbi:hypothetical protein COCNU_05G004320 [Cocos nucifera]|uniref:Phospholipid/glycerol acyltransferase domain-containing protein n=1 Tax=Cocos nucifera TaxID=13894 RepID=A0A8K0I894_COCNU|nr:hypothetical protein COCNU_05G004320 [Cocos nucifera]